MFLYIYQNCMFSRLKRKQMYVPGTNLFVLKYLNKYIYVYVRTFELN